MRCEQAREALSARLDGEDRAGERDRVEAHLAGCAACRLWWDRAAAVTRLVRTGPAAEPATEERELLDAVLAVAPSRRWSRGGVTLRVALAAIGFAQFVIGIVQVAGMSMMPAQRLPGGMTSDHLWHESAAWNIAIGAGYAWIAVRRVRPGAVLPMLTAFVGVLSLLSIDDISTGEVTAAALWTHGFVVLGYLIVLALRHPGFDTTPPEHRVWRTRFDDAPEPEARIVPLSRPADEVTARAGHITEVAA